MIDWTHVITARPTEGLPVIVTGFNMGKPEHGRWVSLAIRQADDTYISTETGNELFPPTHWAIINLP